MSQILLSYAAFAYYTAENDYKIQHVSAGCISFWYERESKSHPLQIVIDEPDSDCGYVVINTEKLDIIFNKNNELIETIKSIERKHRKLSNNRVLLEHCKIDIPHSIREKMVTEIHGGEVVRCKSIKE